MASTSTSKESCFQKTVCLKDWWLVKAEKDVEGKRLAVAGFTSREKQAVRVFSSAPILNRYDVFSLETVDGICVIIEGLMNKARTEKNGFPSEVCNHFVFGFPPYWEIYARKCLEGESTVMGDAQTNADFERLSPQAGRTGSSSKSMAKNFDKACSESETQEYRNKKKLEIKSSSKGGKKEPKRNSKDEEVKSAFDSNTYPVGPDVSERETSCGDSSVENRKNLELSGSHFDNSIAQTLTPPGLEENSVSSSTTGNANHTENENYGGRKCGLKNLQNHYKNSPLSACRLTKERGTNTTVQSLKDPSKVNSSKMLATRMVFNREADTSEELSSHSDGRGITCSEKKAKGKFKDNQMFYDKLKDEKIMSVSVSLRGFNAVGNSRANLDDGSRGKSPLNTPGTEIQDLTDEMTSRNSDARSSEHIVELDHGISLTSNDAKQYQNHVGVQENGKMQNEIDGYRCSSRAHGDTEKRKKKIASGKQSSSQSESLSARKPRRKLDGPVSQKEKEESSVVSPQSLSLKRSRSGRWLLPSLEFWRNQRVIYDADHQITGIKDLH